MKPDRACAPSRARGARVPAWTLHATRALARAAGSVRMIASSTPLNFRAELDRLRQAWAAGAAEPPEFAYAAPPDHSGLRRALEQMAALLEKEDALGAIYAARARELAVEAEICETVGSRRFWGAARRRFGRRDVHDEQADEQADAWLAAAPGASDVAARTPADREATIVSDDQQNPASLVSRLRQELGARRLPLRLIVSRDLASLAATGDGAVQVVAGRLVSKRDVERTVLHEIEGHVLPRLAASEASLGVFAIGTAYGSDDQEGRALAIERGAGFLDTERRREIALRHLAARSVERGEDFVATTRLLLGRSAPLPVSLRIAARAHRGGGLAREAVYLPALLRVERVALDNPAAVEVMRRGRVSLDAAPVLAPWVE